jgi:hypothetical protein
LCSKVKGGAIKDQDGHVFIGVARAVREIMLPSNILTKKNATAKTESTVVQTMDMIS